MFRNLSLSLSLSLSKFVSLSLFKFVSICLVQSRAVESYINVCFQLYLSLQLCLHRSSLIESSRKFSLSLQVCLHRSSLIESSRKFSLSLQFCIYRSSLIESSRKQILLRKSYREQPQILSKRVQPEMFVFLSIHFSLQFCLCVIQQRAVANFIETCSTRNVYFPLKIWIVSTKRVQPEMFVSLSLCPFLSPSLSRSV